MAHSTKVAVSMPKEVFQSVEQARRKLKLTRSEAVVKAIQAWLKQQEEQEMVRQYVEGYRRHPERVSPGEAKARMKLTAEAFRKEAPWR